MCCYTSKKKLNQSHALDQKGDQRHHHCFYTDAVKPYKVLTWFAEMRIGFIYIRLDRVGLLTDDVVLVFFPSFIMCLMCLFNLPVSLIYDADCVLRYHIIIYIESIEARA